jgi:peptidoglycan hydrolase-like protein with peptidoglycan-binding domain
MVAAARNNTSQSVSQTRPRPAAKDVNLKNLSLLREGSRSPQVVKLQNLLKNAGFNPGSADGVFGPKTEAAVKSYQRKNDLAVDGVVGQQTWSSLLGGKAVSPGSNMLRPAPSGGGSSGASSDPIGNVGSFGGSNSQKLQYAMNVAKKMGLTITSTTGGTHAPGSYHYSARAIDVAGSPAAMARYYRFFQSKGPTELFYDPLGGIKYGQSIGAIGGHGDHVHVAF